MTENKLQALMRQIDEWTVDDFINANISAWPLDDLIDFVGEMKELVASYKELVAKLQSAVEGTPCLCGVGTCWLCTDPSPYDVLERAGAIQKAEGGE